MSAYPKADAAQSSVFGREVSELLQLARPLDCVAYLSELQGADVAQRWSDAIRSVTVRDVAPDSGPVTFEGNAQHPANTPHERRFMALMLLIQGSCSTRRLKDLRAGGKGLWRGRQHRFRVTDDGEWAREYVQNGTATGKGHHGGHQGGLAARLGVCVRTVDRYLAIAKAAGLLQVWQVKARKAVEALPKHLKGKQYAYAMFRWLGDLPGRVLERLSGRIRVPAEVPALETPPPSRATGATPAEADAGAEWLEQVRRGAGGRSRPPT